MDIATVSGLTLGVFLIVGSILLGGSAHVFFHVPSIMITIGGTIAATLINFPIDKFKGILTVTKKAFLFTLPLPEDMIQKLLDYNKIMKKEGVNVLEDRMGEMYPFLRNGVQLLMDNVPPESIREILTTEVESSQERHAMGKKILDSMGAAAPAFGMIGTLIGLVQMLQNLSDPTQIGIGMATALLTTFYGAVLANLIFIPLAGKLETRDYEETLLHTMLIEGVLSLKAGEHPFIMKERLKIFLAFQTRGEVK